MQMAFDAESGMDFAPLFRKPTAQLAQRSEAMALIHDSRPSDYGSGESEPDFNRGNLDWGPATETAEAPGGVVEAIGAGMESVGRSIYQHAPDHGVLGTAGHAVGSKLEAGGHYLEDRGLDGIGADVTSIIRRHPVPALVIGFGIGILAARLFRR
jgi:hypothetical protein